MPTTVKYRTLELADNNVPVIELTGDQDGPRLTVLAGVHGCEYAPMAAVRRWTQELAAQNGLRGSVTAVPVLNLTSFRSRTPFVTPEDGKNLNRCFPGDPNGHVQRAPGRRRVPRADHRRRCRDRRARRGHGGGAGAVRAL